ncbi:MAG: MazG nucleotide pyrophosphohydrolase domain-containing protein [Pirellulaceae bacterium]|jgi:NTP pyrophosphatase (non-canonical NTP hydrolase)|nr:MazG nucleotide pyrophosphohydrolase domain-containing protein [Pirellulaceae bacterium]MDP7019459.1 MazG nucleotide pyrophosphohydrolase domain-containing protein [Pirellulaceae bacterium]
MPDPKQSITVAEFQQWMRDMYLEKDRARGVDGTFMWLMEEVGELAAALREGDPVNQQEEFADVLAWLTTIANVVDVDLTEALLSKYGSGCPGCGQWICICPGEGKP